MKTSVLLLLIVLLTGCAKVNVKVSEDEGWDISYNVLWRELEALEVEVNGVKVSLGRTGSEVTPDKTMIACMLAPALCK